MADRYNGMRIFPGGRSLRAWKIPSDDFQAIESGETLNCDIGNLTRWTPQRIDSTRSIEYSASSPISLLHYDRLVLPEPVLSIRFIEPSVRETERIEVSASIVLSFEGVVDDGSTPPPQSLASLPIKLACGPGGMECRQELSSPILRWQRLRVAAGKLILAVETSLTMAGVPSIEAGSSLSVQIEFGEEAFLILPARLLE